jgi:DNA-binding MarR family transcriptional regulator
MCARLNLYASAYILPFARHDALCVPRLHEEDALTIPYRDYLPAQLARLSALAQGMLASALAQCDMTVAHWRILICLVERGPSSLNEVVDFTHLPQSSLSRSVARLEERRAVSGKRDADDRRRMTIEITDAGRAMLDAAAAVVDRNVNEALPLPPEELERFKSTLRYLIERLA